MLCCLSTSSQSQKPCVVCNPPCRSCQTNKWIFKYGEAYFSIPFPWCFRIRRVLLHQCGSECRFSESKHSHRLSTRGVYHRTSARPEFAIGLRVIWYTLHQINNENDIWQAHSVSTAPIWNCFLKWSTWWSRFCFIKSALGLWHNISWSRMIFFFMGSKINFTGFK